MRAQKIIDPISPHSSAYAEKIKSVSGSGRNFRRDWVPKPKPLPVSSPEPTAIVD